MKNLNKLKKNALIGVLIICVSGILTFGFKNLLHDIFGTFFDILIFLLSIAYGLYLILPYIDELDDPNKPWNKKF